MALLGFTAWRGNGRPDALVNKAAALQAASASKAAKVLVSLLCVTGVLVVLLGSLRAVQAEYGRRARLRMRAGTQ